MSNEEGKSDSKCEHCGKFEYDLNECSLCGDKICGECSLLITAYHRPFSVSYQQCGTPSTVWVGSGTMNNYSISNIQGSGMGPSPSQQKPDMIICTTCGDKLQLALRVAASGEK